MAREREVKTLKSICSANDAKSTSARLNNPDGVLLRLSTTRSATYSSYIGWVTTSAYELCTR